MRGISERIGNEDEMYRQMGEDWKANLRVAIPGIIDSFDATTQTVTVQPAIREKIIKEDGSQEWVKLPLLVDVPIVLARAGGYVLTMPIQQGDECLVIFSDRCIDAWFSNSGIQNQIESRKHDLSDSFAILGCWSQPNVIPSYSTNSAQLRNIEGTEYIELKSGEINLVSTSVKKNGVEVATLNDIP